LWSRSSLRLQHRWGWTQSAYGAQSPAQFSDSSFPKPVPGPSSSLRCIWLRLLGHPGLVAAVQLPPEVHCSSVQHKSASNTACSVVVVCAGRAADWRRYQQHLTGQSTNRPATNPSASRAPGHSWQARASTAAGSRTGTGWCNTSVCIIVGRTQYCWHDTEQIETTLLGIQQPHALHNTAYLLVNRIVT
jgi:hypothetical protein